MHKVVVWVALAAVVEVGCTKAQTAQARGKDDSAKQIKTAVVKQDALRRAVDVVGTLAAEDQVTISSQADGTVSRILADLGDHVRSGQVLVELDREKSEYNLDQQRAALTRALAKF